MENKFKTFSKPHVAFYVLKLIAINYALTVMPGLTRHLVFHSKLFQMSMLLPYKSDFFLSVEINKTNHRLQQKLNRNSKVGYKNLSGYSIAVSSQTNCDVGRICADTNQGKRNNR